MVFFTEVDTGGSSIRSPSGFGKRIPTLQAVTVPEFMVLAMNGVRASLGADSNRGKERN